MKPETSFTREPWADPQHARPPRDNGRQPSPRTPPPGAARASVYLKPPGLPGPPPPGEGRLCAHFCHQAASLGFLTPALLTVFLLAVLAVEQGNPTPRLRGRGFLTPLWSFCFNSSEKHCLLGKKIAALTRDFHHVLGVDSTSWTLPGALRGAPHPHSRGWRRERVVLRPPSRQSSLGLLGLCSPCGVDPSRAGSSTDCC